MLFENPALAAKLPFPYNVPPPLQAAAAAAAVPNLSLNFPFYTFFALHHHHKVLLCLYYKPT
ncbi:unnamed protein product, partial [Ceratitis capitata]